MTAPAEMPLTKLAHQRVIGQALLPVVGIWLLSYWNHRLKYLATQGPDDPFVMRLGVLLFLKTSEYGSDNLELIKPGPNGYGVLAKSGSIPSRDVSIPPRP